MKVNIQKEDLLYAVQAVERAVSNKNTLPVLGGILITAKDGLLSFRATDLEMAMECVINGDIVEEGEVAVPGRKFAGITRLLPSANISLASMGREQLLVEYERSQMSVPCFLAEEFPALPQPEGEIHGTIPVKPFRRLVRQVSIAAANDEVRPVFTGILLEISGDKITMVATDTHRLAKGVCAWHGQGEASLIIPCRTLQEIARLAVNEEEEITLTANRNQAYFRLGNLTFTSRVIVGQYPDYKQVLPADNLFCCHSLIHNHRLCNALERASLISRDVTRGKGNIVRLTFEGDKLFLAAEVPDEGTIKEELAAEIQGETLVANYNARYLLEALKVIDDETVCFRLTGSTTPGIIEGASDENKDYLYLVLPVRVNR